MTDQPETTKSEFIMPLTYPGRDALIGLIIRDVCEIERDPLPDQPHGEMRVTVDELRMILEDRLT